MKDKLEELIDEIAKSKIQGFSFVPKDYHTMEDFLFDLEVRRINWKKLKGEDLRTFRLVVLHTMFYMSSDIKNYGYVSKTDFIEYFSRYLPEFRKGIRKWIKKSYLMV